MSSSTSLPLDIRKCIVDYLPTPRDQLWLARTCKDWYFATLPRLYSHVRFRCKGGRDTERAVALLAAENSGRQYIRHVTIIPLVQECELHDDSPELDALLQLFAHLLPAHKLHTFVIESAHRLDTRAVKVLHQRQRNLDTLRLDWRETDGHPSLGAFCAVPREFRPFDISKITRVQVFIPRTWPDPYFLGQMPALKQLEIVADLPGLIHEQQSSIDRLLTSKKWTRRILKDIYNPEPDTDDLMQGAMNNMSKLEVLALHGLDLQVAMKYISCTLRSPSLHTLSIQHCTNSAHVLRACAEDAGLLPGVKHLVIIGPHEESLESGIEVSSVNALLSRLSGLESILLSGELTHDNAPTDQGVLTTAITLHRETLRFLYVDAALHDRKELFGRIRPFPRLEQLALPDIGNGLCWSMDCRALEFVDDHYAKVSLRLSRSLRSFCLLNASTTLSNLAVLGSELEHSVQDKRTGIVIERTYRKMAEGLFWAAPQITAVGTGRKTRDPKPETVSSDPRYYLRSKSIDYDGRQSVAATEIDDIERIRAIEPACDIFNVVCDSKRMVRIHS